MARVGTEPPLQDRLQLTNLGDVGLVQELVENVEDVAVHFGGHLHEGGLHALRARPALGPVVIHLPLVLQVVFVADEDAGQLLVIDPLLFYLFPNLLHYLERITVVYGVDQDERVRRRYGQSAHRRKRQIPGCVEDVHFENGAFDIVIAAVQVLHRLLVVFWESTMQEAIHYGRLAHPTGSEHNHSVPFLTHPQTFQQARDVLTYFCGFSSMETPSRKQVANE